MKFLYFTISSILFISCSSLPKEYLTTNSSCYYNDPIFKITKDEMVFDVKKYKDTLDKGRLVFTKRNNLKNNFHKSKDGSITFKQTNKRLNIQRTIEYDKKGNILLSYFKYLNGSSYLKKETTYDQQGNITKVIDYEKGYQICWTEAIEIVKQIAKKDIKKYNVTSFNLLRNDMNEFPDLKPEWEITLNGNEEYEEKKYSKKGKKIYIIDGITGNLTNIKTIRMIYPGME